jgi:hypothetical protein
MADMTAFTYGDSVCVIDGVHKGKTGSVVGMDHPDTPSIFTIEFGKGGGAEIPLEFLERLPD